MKTFLKATTALAIASSFSAHAVAAEMLKEIGPGEGEVSIVAWAGYIERGETDKNYDWVTDFEKATGCKVSVKTAATSDEMVTLMNQGGFDLVTASGDASLRLIAGGKVQPVNVDLIKSWATVDDRLKDAAWHTVDGVHYGTPYQWGPNVLMYNSKVFGDQPPTSWNVVFEEMTLPDGKSNKGRVQAFDGPIYIADGALYLKHKQPELGIQYPYELNEEQYASVLELLKGQRSLIGRYWHDATVQIDDFKNEGVVASGSWPFQVNLLEADVAGSDHGQMLSHGRGLHGKNALVRLAYSGQPSRWLIVRSSRGTPEPKRSRRVMITGEKMLAPAPAARASR